MRSKFVIFGLLVFFLVNCTKPEKESQDKTYKLKEGKYTGTFYRTISWKPTTYSAVTITFTSNKWEGTSEEAYYPALCHGTYELKDTFITFINECAFPAHFDWNLILAGGYNFLVENDTLKFSKIIGVDSTNFVTKNVYKLTYQK
jgi:hypothetical protein